MTETPFMHLIRPSVAAPAVASAGGPAHIRIHASAIAQVLENVSKQILPGNKRIIGTLLGSRSDDGLTFEIRDAFLVPCNETGDSVAIEEHTHKTLFQLYKKAHPKEHVLGWFGSLAEIDSTTGLIHDFYSKGSDRAFPYPAIYLNADFLDENKQIKTPTITTYIGAAIGKPASGIRTGWKPVNTVNSYIFTPIPNEIITNTNTEKLTLNLLNNQQSGPLKQQSSQLTQDITKVGNNIDDVLKYLESFDSSDENVDLLRYLSNQLLSRPQSLSELDELKSHFRAHNQDVIMIEYLTRAMKEQIERSARLSAEVERK